MKKLIGLLVVFGVGMGLFFLFTKNEVSQVSLMEEAVATLEDYDKGGEASETIQKLEELAEKLSKLNTNSEASEKSSDDETKAKADRLRGELANASMELEISEKETARDVSKALDKFIGQ